MLTLSVATGTITYRPGLNEESTAPIEPDGTFHLKMTSNVRYPGTHIVIDGVIANGAITGQFEELGSYSCLFSFALARHLETASPR